MASGGGGPRFRPFGRGLPFLHGNDIDFFFFLLFFLFKKGKKKSQGLATCPYSNQGPD